MDDEREPDIDNDEFKCDRCGGIFDIEVSVRIGKDILVCEACVEQRLGY